MARVFLSYDREDSDRGRRISNALEKAGHSVWWDRRIKSGALYSREIDEALKRSDVVVVLWSEKSIESAWVRDEAAAGRDSGKLVPARIDDVDPPLGFRQYQTTDLTRWKGRRTPEFDEMLEAIAALPKQSTAEQAVPAPLGAQPKKQSLGAVAVVATALLIMIALIAWRFTGGASSVPVVAVAPSDSSPTSNTLARDVFVKLGRLQAADADSLQLIEASSDRRPDFTFQVGGSTEGRNSVANMALIGSRNVLLWSKDFERPAEHSSDLRQQLSFTAARVLGCAKEAVRSEAKLDHETLRLYLSGCASYAELSGSSVGDVRSVIPIFTQVIQRVPQFRGAWAKLLLAEAEIATNSLLADRASAENALRAHVTVARRLDPRMPEILQAEILLLPVTAVNRRMELVDKAIELHPDNAGLLSLRSNLLMAVGRMNAAVQDAKHAAEIDAISPAARMAYIAALAHSGQLDLAQHELRDAELIWPGASALSDIRFSIDLRYGDPAAALEQMRTGAFRSEIPASQESFLQARINPTRENVARALAVTSAVQSYSIRPMIQVLAQFGREEEVIERLLRYDINRTEQFTDVLFRPNTRKLRQHPQFMRVAKRLGLLDYWMKTGHWPDFCFEPDLPYDCKGEAKKLAGISV